MHPKRNFNSHPHEEDDNFTMTGQPSGNHFNSHPHEEDDNFTMTGQPSGKNFNSHPHEEDDNFTMTGQPSGNHFNSHPHEEDDLADEVINFQEEISTHILTRRMTGVKVFLGRVDVFQLTSSRGG